jgi:predicted metal-binding membrane protein
MSAGAALTTSPGALPRRDKVLVLAALAAVILLAWGYLVLHSAHMSMEAAGHAMMGMTGMPWSAGQAGLTLLMWAVMMVAMMLPSATPMVLTYAAVVRRVAQEQSPTVSIAVFAAGYVLVWSGFSLAATGLQWTLEQMALLSPALVASSHLLGGGLLILAGLYQWAPLKEFCLRHCQSPLGFISRHWRTGQVGALRMGLRHGVYCVGCCWALMLLLFVGGVMNLLWVAAIAGFVLVEKLVPTRSRLGRWISGGGLVLAGAIVLSGFGGM